MVFRPSKSNGQGKRSQRLTIPQPLYNTIVEGGGGVLVDVNAKVKLL